MYRRKACPGSLELESRFEQPEDDADDEYKAEGRLLHRMMADPSLSREELTPEQLETLERAEAQERAFLQIVQNELNKGP